ncbi:hypothetical protein [Pedobacter jejuensis]|uniref:Extracellular endo-alpha-(1->5)-L-arabinanase C-terminal domain-containing protein n=1 Tax=Pedobacter jejuensis TaxID=1268550 RepID=A0A3N0BWW9_9SPHI|nr:hypothetical protein [Pedobacter jejuensis]RNL53768.1 hypothetical protein D7004_09535 [Pedobacter jejuensis]
MKNKKNFILMKGTVMLLFVCAILSCGSQTADYENRIIGSWVGEIKLPNNGKSIGNMHLEFTREGAFFQTTGEGAEKWFRNRTIESPKTKSFIKEKQLGMKN